MSPLSRGDDLGRLAAGVLLLGAVHVALFVQGNERATPPRLLLSFAVTTTLLWIAQRFRGRLHRSAAVPTATAVVATSVSPSPSPSMSPPSTLTTAATATGATSAPASAAEVPR
jgi:hypothetical protein